MASIGVLMLELHIEHAQSLKDKRNVVRGLKERLRQRHNVSVAEVGRQDLWQHAMVAAVTVSPERGFAEKILHAVENDAAGILGGMLVGSATEWIDAG